MISIRAVAVARSMIRSAVSTSACTQRFLNNSPIPLIVKRRISVNLVNMIDPRRVVSYEEVSKYTQQSDKLIIDVRNPDEVSSTVGHVEYALQSMSEEEFRRCYHRDKPQPSSELIFYCRSGRRSSEALNKALQLGYSNSKTYVGSWEEWSNKTRQQ